MLLVIALDNKTIVKILIENEKNSRIKVTY